MTGGLEGTDGADGTEGTEGRIGNDGRNGRNGGGGTDLPSSGISGLVMASGFAPRVRMSPYIRARAAWRRDPLTSRFPKLPDLA